jgi:multiple sugar transport system ATP-binding protein
MSSIEIKNVTKSYGAMQVLHGVDLNIIDKEFVVLVGPSGCGKSTLLRMIAGLEEISTGDVLIDGNRINDVSPQKRDLAMVFQSYALYPHMTVEENMGFSLSLRGARKDQIRKEVGDAAKILHLEDYLERLPKNLSGGQRQRVAMGRAIVRHPKAFLFDEPLSNLDAKLRTHMRAEIRQLHQALNATSVYVTHDQIEAMTLADRIVVMNAGQIEQVGTPIDVFDKPMTKFVAGFIGAPTMNFFDGSVEVDLEGRPHLTMGPNKTPVMLPRTMSDQAGRQITVGIRPQHMRVSKSTGGGDAIAASIDLVEQTGCETNLLLSFSDQKVTVQIKERMNVVPGENVNLEPETDSLHIFDQESGRRLN